VFQAAGAGGVEPPRRMRLNDLALVLQSATDGHGVALGDDLLVGDDLLAGRLLKPFDIAMQSGAYWLLRGRHEGAVVRAARIRCLASPGNFSVDAIGNAQREAWAMRRSKPVRPPRRQNTMRAFVTYSFAV